MKVQFEQSFIYELNTRIFCKENTCTLDTFSEKFFLSKEFQACDYLWLMGVWAPSPESKRICDRHEGLQSEFHRALPDLTPKDVLGSPYAVYLYEPNPMVAESFEEIGRFKKKINSLGKKLILDFVPNHMAVDTPLLSKNPECFLKGEIHAENNPNYFLHESGTLFAHGRDPYFDGWTDTVQWDFSSPEVFKVHSNIVHKISEVSDGIRCDMAMLPEENIFHRTHGKKGLPYWKPLISEIKSKRKDFIFIAEVYWGMEYELQQKGFDFTYDKELYDRMKKNPLEIFSHLNADDLYQKKSLRFLENHDEERAMEAFGDRSIGLFGILSFLSGMILYHDGQTSGRTKKLPVQLGRRAEEKVRTNIQEFYNRALDAILERKRNEFGLEKYSIFPYCDIDMSRVLAFCLIEKSKFRAELLVYNPYSERIKGRFDFSGMAQSWLDSCKGSEIQFVDIIDGKSYSRKKTDIEKNGLYIELEGSQAHWFVLAG